MRNLFDLAMEIRTFRYITSNLKVISRSTVFPVIPINIQQKVQQKLIEYTAKEKVLMLEWPGDTAVLDGIIEHLSGHPYPDEIDMVFIGEVSSLIKQYVDQSQGQVKEVMRNASVVEIPVPAKRKPRKKKEVE